MQSIHQRAIAAKRNFNSPHLSTLTLSNNLSKSPSFSIPVVILQSLLIKGLEKMNERQLNAKIDATRFALPRRYIPSLHKKKEEDEDKEKEDRLWRELLICD